MKRVLSFAIVLLFLGCTPQKCPEPVPEAKPAVAIKAEAKDVSTKPAQKADEPVLLLDGTPKIPKELKSKLSKYLNTRYAGLEKLSDDASSLLMSTRFAETNQVHLLNEPMGARTQLTFAAEPVSASSFVPGSNNEITFISDRGGNEAFRIYYQDLQTGDAVPFTPDGARVRSYKWTKDGGAIAFNSNERNGKDMDIYVCEDVTNGQVPCKSKARRLVEVKGHWYPYEWSEDRTKLLLGEYISIQESKVHLVDIKTGEVELITNKNASYRDAVFAGSNDKLYVSSDRDGEFVVLYEVDLVKDQWTPLTSDINWNVESLALSGDGKTLAFSVNEDGYSKIYLMDTVTNRRRAAEGIPGGIARGLSFAKNKNVLGFGLFSPISGGDVYTYDIESNKLERWTQSEMGGLKQENLSIPQLVHFKSFDEREVPAFYFKPKGEGPFPVVIRIHGGPESQARPYFSPYIQYLVNELKIAVLMPNVRGSDGYGKTCLGLDNGFKREDSIKDIGALLDWIKENKDLNEQRVGVVGGSYGGYMVLAALVHYGDRIVAGTEIVGISNFVTFLENTKAYRRDLRRAEYGDERDEKMREYLTAISPTENVNKIKSALFVAHGANDPRVPVGEAEQIVKAVRKADRDVWYMLARNEGHGFRKKENRDTYYSLMLMFFEKHLKN